MLACYLNGKEILYLGPGPCATETALELRVRGAFENLIQIQGTYESTRQHIYHENAGRTCQKIV